ncbi:unnamed protein product, partial [Gulo gulo]
MSSEKKRNPGRPDLRTATLLIKLTNGHPQKQKALRRWTNFILFICQREKERTSRQR